MPSVVRPVERCKEREAALPPAIPGTRIELGTAFAYEIGLERSYELLSHLILF